jgi:hypothetical protein
MVLDTLTLMSVTASLCDDAARLVPAELRSLDALHLASALSLHDDLEGMVSYDERLSNAARACGVAVASPA